MRIYERYCSLPNFGRSEQEHEYSEQLYNSKVQGCFPCSACQRPLRCRLETPFSALDPSCWRILKSRHRDCMSFQQLSCLSPCAWECSPRFPSEFVMRGSPGGAGVLSGSLIPSRRESGANRGDSDAVRGKLIAFLPDPGRDARKLAANARGCWASGPFSSASGSDRRHPSHTSAWIQGFSCPSQETSSLPNETTIAPSSILPQLP